MCLKHIARGPGMLGNSGDRKKQILQKYEVEEKIKRMKGRGAWCVWRGVSRYPWKQTAKPGVPCPLCGGGEAVSCNTEVSREEWVPPHTDMRSLLSSEPFQNQNVSETHRRSVA